MMNDAVLGERIRAELAEQGTRLGGKRIARLMRTAGLHRVSKRRAFTTTTQRPTARHAEPQPQGRPMLP